MVIKSKEKNARTYEPYQFKVLFINVKDKKIYRIFISAAARVPSFVDVSLPGN